MEYVYPKKEKLFWGQMIMNLVNTLCDLVSSHLTHYDQPHYILLIGLLFIWNTFNFWEMIIETSFMVDVCLLP